MEDMPDIVLYAAVAKNPRLIIASMSDAHHMPRHDGAAAAAVKFRGVVPQQNGNWGAQIYAKHRRIWLGTFRTDRDAAMAYDSASIMLRRGDTQCNFPWTDHTLLEPTFQRSFPAEDILEMIRDGTYQSKFSEFLRSQFVHNDVGDNNNNMSRRLMLRSDGEFLCKLLFQKELTPSDVGKLNRLVIPKKCAVKYFPYVQELWYGQGDEGFHPNNASSSSGGGEVDDVQLLFYDKGMRLWKFRYCYWKSSQSFVFTRGWKRFVKDKKLKAKDCVLFYACQRGEGSGVVADMEEKFCLIDVEYNNDNNNDDGNGGNGMEVELRLNLGNEDVGEEEEEQDDDEELGESGFRLFGVQINADCPLNITNSKRQEIFL